MDLFHLSTRGGSMGGGSSSGASGHDSAEWDFEIVPDRGVWRLRMPDPPASCPAGWEADDSPTWVDALETAAVTLERATSRDVSAVSVTCGLGGAPSEVERLVLLVGRLVDQFCLDARVRMRERGFTVRFTRGEPE